MIRKTNNLADEICHSVDSMNVYSKLLHDRIIFINGELTSENCNIIKTQLLYLDNLSNDDITLMIDSPGGDIYTSLGLIDTMEMLNCDIITINMGLAASMASLILCCGTKGKRKSLKRSRTMIHQPLTYLEGYIQGTDITIEAKEMNYLKNELYTIISEKTGQSFDKIKNDCERDYYLNPIECINYGLIDEIITKLK